MTVYKCSLLCITPAKEREGGRVERNSKGWMALGETRRVRPCMLKREAG
jgi:hypothetical protein